MYNSISDLDIQALNAQGVEVRPFRDDEFSVPKTSGAGQRGLTHVSYNPKHVKSGVDLYLAVEDSDIEAHVRLEYPFSKEALDEAILDMEYANEDALNQE